MNTDQFMECIDLLASRYRECLPRATATVAEMLREANEIDSDLTHVAAALAGRGNPGGTDTRLTRSALAEANTAVQSDRELQAAIKTHLEAMQSMLKLLQQQVGSAASMKSSNPIDLRPIVSASVGIASTIAGSLASSPAFQVSGYAMALAGLLEACDTTRKMERDYQSMKAQEGQDELTSVFLSLAEKCILFLMQLSETGHGLAVTIHEQRKDAGTGAWVRKYMRTGDDEGASPLG